MVTHRRIILLLALLASLVLVSAVLSAPAITTLERYVMAGGGGHIEAGIYALEGSIGQPLVGLDSAAPYELCSGFWCGQSKFYTFLPLIMRQFP
jgi:hypothetical protein